jgi:hypothetical protein
MLGAREFPYDSVGISSIAVEERRRVRIAIRRKTDQGGVAPAAHSGRIAVTQGKAVLSECKTLAWGPWLVAKIETRSFRISEAQISPSNAGRRRGG